MRDNWECEEAADAWYIRCNGRRVLRVVVNKDEAPTFAEAIVSTLTIGTKEAKRPKRKTGA